MIVSVNFLMKAHPLLFRIFTFAAQTINH